jgi:hypothetical protein
MILPCHETAAVRYRKRRRRDATQTVEATHNTGGAGACRVREMEDGVAESNEQTELVSEGVDEGEKKGGGENKRKEVDQEEIGGRKKIAKPDQTRPGQERRGERQGIMGHPDKNKG